MQKTLKIGCAEGTVDTLGGELISYKNCGKDYIWTGDEKYWNGHAPILFPFVSALRNQKIAFDGVTYTYAKKHGFARKTQFELAECTESKAVFRLVSGSGTKAFYPYDFILTVSHEISEAGYKTTYYVKNTGNADMQFCIGGHAGFCVDGSAEDYELKFEKPENTDLYYTDEKSLFSESYKIKKRLDSDTFPILYSDFDIDAIIAKDIKSRKVKLVKKSDGTGVEFDFGGFHVLTLWTPPKKHAPFFCLEPWNGLPAYTDESGDFEDKPYRIVLPSGSDYSVGYKVSVLK
jgi:galactose mutarotase-like enzyme